MPLKSKLVQSSTNSWARNQFFNILHYLVALLPTEDIVVTEYRSLGCWADTSEWRDPSKRAMMVMEGLDPNLADNYHERKQPISKCADVAKRLGLKVFAIQNGGQCFGGADDNSYKRYGSSENCGDGVGGPLANDVYKLWVFRLKMFLILGKHLSLLAITQEAEPASSKVKLQVRHGCNEQLKHRSGKIWAF